MSRTQRRLKMTYSHHHLHHHHHRHHWEQVVTQCRVSSTPSRNDWTTGAMMWNCKRCLHPLLYKLQDKTELTQRHNVALKMPAVNFAPSPLISLCTVCWVPAVSIQEVVDREDVSRPHGSNKKNFRFRLLNWIYWTRPLGKYVINTTLCWPIFRYRFIFCYF